MGKITQNKKNDKKGLRNKKLNPFIILEQY
jgi:hypothetical protein